MHLSFIWDMAPSWNPPISPLPPYPRGMSFVQEREPTAKPSGAGEEDAESPLRAYVADTGVALHGHALDAIAKVGHSPFKIRSPSRSPSSALLPAFWVGLPY